MLIGLFVVGLIIGVIVMAFVVRSMMPIMMFAKNKSKLNFEETISAINISAKKNGWEIPEIRDLQQDYKEAGLEDMTKLKIIYFCNPNGGYRILKDDNNKQMSVMMPMGVSVYETDNGQVYVAAMNLGTMSMMFGGTVKEVLKEGAGNYKNALKDIIEK
jgi:uncharacterized protein (DUF302 family)